MMKPFRWREEKNGWLKENRGISFEEIIGFIAENLLDVRANRSSRHQQQRVFIVSIKGYPWIVPFVETENEIELITAFPDRRLLKEFMK